MAEWRCRRCGRPIWQEMYGQDPTAEALARLARVAPMPAERARRIVQAERDAS
jgi:hypothetical protein